jgi:Na+-transporting NADH:ubiquinone oxidoreductase subunit A
MEKISISKGFKIKLIGAPDTSMIEVQNPDTIAVSALNIPFIKPKLLVKKDEDVKIGTPIFFDKRQPDIHYLSPGAGRVNKIIFGKRRRLHEVVIKLVSKKKWESFDTIEESSLAQTGKTKLIELLIKGGLWQCLRQLPFADTANPETKPPLIIVSLNENDIFAPDPAVYLENETRLFNFGLSILNRITRRVIITARQDHIKKLMALKIPVTHIIPDFYPAWNPGAVLYHIKKTAEENNAWTISGQQLLLIAKLIKNGRYPVKRVVTVSNARDKRPHLLIRQGMSIKSIVGSTSRDDLITTGMFNGRIVNPDAHLGFFENTLNILKTKKEEEFLGFIRPGPQKASVSTTFLSCLSNTPKDVDCDTHGDERACINCAYCHKICPNDLMPNFIMKALYSDDLEDALDMGMLDCCNCGLCSYTCPSKIELAHIFQNAMNTYYKDKA